MQLERCQILPCINNDCLSYSRFHQFSSHLDNFQDPGISEIWKNGKCCVGLQHQFAYADRLNSVVPYSLVLGVATRQQRY